MQERCKTNEAARMRLELSDQTIHNLINDFKKKEINPKERAEILLEYRKHKGISQRQLAKNIGISHSVIQDWELWNKITTEQIKFAKTQGFNNTDIYKSLRSNNAQIVRHERAYIDVILQQAIIDLRRYVHQSNYSEKTSQLIKDLTNVLNRILMRADK